MLLLFVFFVSSFPNKSKFAQMELHIRIFASLKKFSTVRPFLDEAVHCITCLADVGKESSLSCFGASVRQERMVSWS